MALDQQEVARLVRAALNEDIGGRDVTTEAIVPRGSRALGVVLAKQPLLLAGTEVAATAFRLLDPDSEWSCNFEDGARVQPGDRLATITGRAAALLGAERVALNFLQRLTGVATLTRSFVDAVAGTRARIRDTRKTTPLLRCLEKHAVECGGGVPHRAGLDSGVLVKENHIRLAGSVREATSRARAGAGALQVQVEVEQLEQIEEALGAGAQMILLDNFAPERVHEAVRLVAGRVPIEVSGGVSLDTVGAFAAAGPDYIAVGALTHSAPAVDISLEIEPF